MTENTITVNARAFADLLRDVEPFALADDTLPILNGVALRTALSPAGGDVLVAGATDRYMLMQGFIGATGQFDGQVLVPLDAIARVRHVLDTSDPAGPATLAVSESSIRIRRESPTEQAAITVELAKWDFPDLGALIATAKDAEVTGESPVLDARRLAQFAEVARRHGTYYAGMRMRSSGPTSSTLVQIGQHLVGLLMPIRPDERLSADVPVFRTEKADEAAA